MYQVQQNNIFVVKNNNIYNVYNNVYNNIYTYIIYILLTNNNINE